MDSEDESLDMEEIKVVVKSPKATSVRESMRRLLFHHLLLKERMKDYTINYIDLLCSDPLPATSDEE